MHGTPSKGTWVNPRPPRGSCGVIVAASGPTSCRACCEMAKCSRTNVDQKCDSRREAQRSGEMTFLTSGYHPGWKYPVDIFYGAYKPPPIFSWTHCPFCNEPLPEIEDMVKRIFG